MSKPALGTFWDFYRHAYRDEHKVPINIAIHMAGTIAGVLLLVASFTVISTWWALAFPVVHVVPGLIGHRLFERAEDIGDARIFRTDLPAWWFILANHMMTARMLWTCVTLRWLR
jgi:hypothetical protein